MSDRKYRQRGYQDGDRDRERPKSSGSRGPRPREERIGPRTPNLMGFREVVRCTRCGALVGEGETQCAQCRSALHSCAQCAHFDTGARFECTRPIPARVSPKDAHNECAFFSPRVSVERQTGSSRAPGRSTGAAPVSDARKAFDDLFK